MNKYYIMTKIIFIHIPKTAGYTIGRSLNDIDALHSGYGFSHEIARKIVKPHHTKEIIMAVVRNPYDRMYSIYEFYRKKRTDISKNVTFENFILNFEKQYYLKKPQFNTCYDYVINKSGKIMATDILHFENLQKDYEHFCKKYDIKNNLVVRNKNELKNENVDFKTLYTEDMKKVIERVFRNDFREFNYSYEKFIESKTK